MICISDSVPASLAALANVTVNRFRRHARLHASQREGWACAVAPGIAAMYFSRLFLGWKAEVK